MRARPAGTAHREHRRTEVTAEPRRFSLVPADVPLPDVPGLRAAPPGRSHAAARLVAAVALRKRTPGAERPRHRLR